MINKAILSLATLGIGVLLMIGSFFYGKKMGSNQEIINQIVNTQEIKNEMENAKTIDSTDDLHRVLLEGSF